MGLNQVNVPHSPDIYGYEGDANKISTPNVARLASEGLLFQNFYASFHVCSPSRASILTGRYSIRSGIGIPNDRYAPDAPGPSSGGNMVFTAESVGGLPLNETTTAEALKAEGYATLAIGKWHLGARQMYLPTSRGFDEYLGIPFSQDMGESFWGPETPHLPFQPTALPLLNGTTIVEQPVALNTLAEKYVDKVSSFIKRMTSSDTPFFAYVAFNHIHEPNSCSAQRCNSSIRGPVGDAVQELDWAVGQIMSALESSGADNNTLTIFTSDNGAPLGNDNHGNLPLRGGKSQCWEGGFRVPGIARWPGKIAPNTQSRAIAGTIDLHPTFLSLAGASLPADRVIDGQDLSPVLFDKAAHHHDCYFFYNAAAAANAEKELWAVRCGAYKAYWSTNTPGPSWAAGPQDPPLMFHLDKDPSESHPIAAHGSEYERAMAPISAARAAHLQTIELVPNQNARGSSSAFALCADPTSTPHNCTLNPENWRPAEVCASKSCLEANPQFVGKCKQHAPGWQPEH
eukprot:CAMPEP_0167795494 /NCGR_PEP_ID=MMETSP0111_2-20121227/14475_1 /TAXON_ID=91324 /ORGANISM="Lotharella globosa, Strain CCCM811" /LENGTH=513 /DNA_ID=CAMNT_0007689185 /DNA_START=89 /DNA_END=1630 /DNA_ORIENTATION=-